MKRSMHTLLIAGSFALAAWLSQGSAHAQYRYNPYLQMQQNMYVQQMMAAQQAQLTAQSYYGSTYPNAGYYGWYAPSYTPSYYTPPMVNPYYANPYVATPYVAPPSVPTAPGVGANPYSPVDPSLANPYSPYNPYNPYNSSAYGAGSQLFGAADVMRAYGQQANSIEQARITRELALQARLDTIKKEHDLRMYIKATTPTYTQEQERVAKLTLRRIQTNSLPGEIANGKSLNYLLDDLRKFPNKTISLESITLSDEVLFHLSVTKRTYGMGLLRDNGKVVWPSAVRGRMSTQEREKLEKQLQTLVKEANGGRIDENILKDVRDEISRIREDLVKKVNEVPTGQYLEAKRFLQELEDSSTAVQNGEAQNQVKFQRWIDDGKGKLTIKDLTEYMVKDGLRFGPATAQDESAYRAVHAAMASYDIAMNTQHGSEPQ